MSFGDRLKIARKAKKLTQKDLGKMANVTGSAISNYEKGVSAPNEQILIRLMEILEIDANYLYADEIIKMNNISFLSPDEEHLVSCFRRLNEAGQRYALTAIESFAGNPALTEETEAGVS